MVAMLAAEVRPRKIALADTAYLARSPPADGGSNVGLRNGRSARLALIADPLAEVQRCTARDRRWLRHVVPLLDRDHLD
jgi:hypothetical protein